VSIVQQHLQGLWQAKKMSGRAPEKAISLRGVCMSYQIEMLDTLRIRAVITSVVRSDASSAILRERERKDKMNPWFLRSRPAAAERLLLRAWLSMLKKRCYQREER
jgi:hypothetical protein